MRELSGSDIFESSLPVEGRAIRRITVPVLDSIANVVLGAKGLGVLPLFPIFRQFFHFHKNLSSSVMSGTFILP